MTTTEQIPPVVRLPRPASEIHGRRVLFAPLRERIDQLVRGEARVVCEGRKRSVAIDYISPIEPCHPEVYWLDQSEVNELFQ